nr:NADH dehydrogenase subunit 4L [Pyrrhidium sanguineum]
MYLYVAMATFISGLIVYSSNRKHLLLMLLSLEFITLSLYLIIFLYENNLSYEYFFSMIFLTFSVCEGSLGLAMLVSMIRSCGNDYVISNSILW